MANKIKVKLILEHQETNVSNTQLNFDERMHFLVDYLCQEKYNAGSRG